LATIGQWIKGDVYTLSVYNGELIAGGYFTSAGGITAKYISRWNGTSWQPLAAE
jgi:peptidoglycan hydrolase-like amidase